MRIFLVPICLLFTVVLLAQNSREFTRVNEFYIHGDTQVIGNNNVSKHKNKATDDKSGLNDETKMKYVDIDATTATYNSSSATLSFLKTLLYGMPHCIGQLPILQKKELK